jgi:thioredoxin
MNRVPQEKLEQGLDAVCGRCKTPLPLHNKPILVTDASFSAEVERWSLPILLDMWAPWCGPCRVVAPIDQLAAEMAGRVRVAKLNADENPITAEGFHVRGIPALLLVLKAGRELDRIVDVQPKSEIVRRLERAIAKA